MPLTAAQYKELIPVEVGDASDLVTDNVEVYWGMYDGKPIHQRYLYTKLSTIDLLLGQPSVREAVTYSEDGQSQSLSDLFKHLTSLRTQTLDFIKKYSNVTGTFQMVIDVPGDEEEEV